MDHGSMFSPGTVLYELLDIIHIDWGSTENLDDSTNEIPRDLTMDPLHISSDEILNDKSNEIPENIDPLGKLTIDILHESEDPMNINIEEVDVDELPKKSNIIELHRDYMQADIHSHSCFL